MAKAKDELNSCFDFGFLFTANLSPVDRGEIANGEREAWDPTSKTSHISQPPVVDQQPNLLLAWRYKEIARGLRATWAGLVAGSIQARLAKRQSRARAARRSPCE
jgi:hypothetical protein